MKILEIADFQNSYLISFQICDGGKIREIGGVQLLPRGIISHAILYRRCLGCNKRAVKMLSLAQKLQ